jgi:hypothetical protein
MLTALVGMMDVAQRGASVPFKNKFSCVPLVLVTALLVTGARWATARQWPGVNNLVSPALALLLGAALWVGIVNYRRIPEVSAAGDDASSRQLLHRTVAVALTVAVTGLSCVLLIRGGVGIASPAIDWLPIMLAGAAAALCLLGAGQAARARTTAADDLLRVNRPALVLALVGLTIAAGGLTWELLTRRSMVHGIGVAYVGTIALSLALLYAEDLVATPVRLQLVRPQWTAYLIAVSAAVVMALSGYRTVTIGLLSESGPAMTLVATLSSAGNLLLTIIAVAGCGMLLALSTSPGQWLTEQGPDHNMVQGQALYGVLTAVSLYTASSVLADLYSGSISRVVALTGISAATVGIFWFTKTMNVKHLETQRTRIQSVVMRTSDPVAMAQRRAKFLSILETHLKVQFWIPLFILLGSGLLILRLFA